MFLIVWNKANEDRTHKQPLSKGLFDVLLIMPGSSDQSSSIPAELTIIKFEYRMRNIDAVTWLQGVQKPLCRQNTDIRKVRFGSLFLLSIQCILAMKVVSSNIEL